MLSSWLPMFCGIFVPDEQIERLKLQEKKTGIRRYKDAGEFIRQLKEEDLWRCSYNGNRAEENVPAIMMKLDYKNKEF